MPLAQSKLRFNHHAGYLSSLMTLLQPYVFLNHLICSPSRRPLSLRMTSYRLSLLRNQLFLQAAVTQRMQQECLSDFL